MFSDNTWWNNFVAAVKIKETAGKIIYIVKCLKDTRLAFGIK